MTLTHILPGILTTWATTGRPPRGDHEYVLWQIGHAQPKNNKPTGPATISTAPANGNSSDAESCTTSPCALEC
jgi:hypothetical protein